MNREVVVAGGPAMFMDPGEECLVRVEAFQAERYAHRDGARMPQKLGQLVLDRRMDKAKRALTGEADTDAEPQRIVLKSEQPRNE